MELLLQADRETDEVFAQFTLVPLPQVNFALSITPPLVFFCSLWAAIAHWSFNGKWKELTCGGRTCRSVRTVWSRRCRCRRSLRRTCSVRPSQSLIPVHMAASRFPGEPQTNASLPWYPTPSLLSVCFFYMYICVTANISVAFLQTECVLLLLFV
mgnify:CR=1 FL=1